VNDNRLYPGAWRVVIVSAFGLVLGYPPLVVFPFSAFLGTLTQSLSWSRSDVSFAFTVSSLIGAGSSPFLGKRSTAGVHGACW